MSHFGDVIKRWWGLVFRGKRKRTFILLLKYRNPLTRGKRVPPWLGTHLRVEKGPTPPSPSTKRSPLFLCPSCDLFLATWRTRCCYLYPPTLLPLRLRHSGTLPYVTLPRPTWLGWTRHHTRDQLKRTISRGPSPLHTRGCFGKGSLPGISWTVPLDPRRCRRNYLVSEKEYKNWHFWSVVYTIPHRQLLYSKSPCHELYSRKRQSWNWNPFN